jgi:hypothetical protein
MPANLRYGTQGAIPKCPVDYTVRWLRDSATGNWYHLATMKIPFAATGINALGGFQEDFGHGNTRPRRTDFRNVYYHKNGKWSMANRFTPSVRQLGESGTCGLIENATAAFFETCSGKNYLFNVLSNIPPTTGDLIDTLSLPPAYCWLTTSLPRAYQWGVPDTSGTGPFRHPPLSTTIRMIDITPPCSRTGIPPLECRNFDVGTQGTPRYKRVKCPLAPGVRRPNIEPKQSGAPPGRVSVPQVTHLTLWIELCRIVPCARWHIPALPPPNVVLGSVPFSGIKAPQPLNGYLKLMVATT